MIIYTNILFTHLNIYKNDQGYSSQLLIVGNDRYLSGAIFTK